MLEVVYLIRETGDILTATFDSAYQCRLFINRCRHSKRVQLISYPNIAN